MRIASSRHISLGWALCRPLLGAVSTLVLVAGLIAQPGSQPTADPARHPGLPARATPADYQSQAKVGDFTIGAEFTGHGIPNNQQPLQSEDYVAVEVALFGPADSRLLIGTGDFSLRINGKKEVLPSQPWGLVAKNVKDPEWVSPDAVPGESKSKGSVSGGGAQGGGNLPPPTPKVPIDTLRAWQLAVRNASLAPGDRPLPQAGLLYFPYRGKTGNIRSIELIYAGPAGSATLTLQ